MRIVIDMQGVQAESSLCGIKRYTLSLVQAIVRNRGRHEIILALSGQFPETIESCRAAFEDLLPPENIRVWYAPGLTRQCDPGNEWRREAAERIREAFWAGLKPDVVFVSSMFEGYSNDAVTSIGVFVPSVPTVVCLYKFNSLLCPDQIRKSSPAYDRFCQSKIESVKSAQGLILLTDHLGQQSDAAPVLERVVGVSSGDDGVVTSHGFSVSISREHDSYCEGEGDSPNWDENSQKLIAIFEDIYDRQDAGLQSHDCVPLLVESISAIDQGCASEQDILLSAFAISANHPEDRPRMLYVDISDLVQKDLGTGIQRVTRSIVSALLSDSLSGYQVKPVFATETSHGYFHANCYVHQLLGAVGDSQEDYPIDPQSGDIFLGLDFVAGIVGLQQHYLKWMYNHGVSIYFVVYDLLPIKLPHCFPEGVEDGHRQWLQIISNFDGAICISQAVQSDLDVWLRDHGAKRLRPFKTGWFHLGADISNSIPTAGMPDDAKDVLAKLEARPSFLMVGSVEPRKGYGQTLSAFEMLWSDGVDVNLVFVGKEGWHVVELVEKIRQHPERHCRLFWLEGVSDEYLENIYAVSTCLIAASEDEGFGLPLIEAAKHKLPIIARDIPVFREVARAGAYYFSGHAPNDIANAIRQWLPLYEGKSYPSSSCVIQTTWRQSADRLVESIVSR